MSAAMRRCFHTDFESTDGIKTITTFEEMGFKHLLCGIYQFGFDKPSPIQQRAVVPIIQGRDVIAQAQSGTGKTSMIALTVCQLVDTSVREFNLKLLIIVGFGVNCSIQVPIDKDHGSKVAD